MTQRVLVRFTADRAVLPGVVAYPKAEVCVVETTYDRLCHMMVLSSHCRLLTTEEAGDALSAADEAAGGSDDRLLPD